MIMLVLTGSKSVWKSQSVVLAPVKPKWEEVIGIISPFVLMASHTMTCSKNTDYALAIAAIS